MSCTKSWMLPIAAAVMMSMGSALAQEAAHGAIASTRSERTFYLKNSQSSQDQTELVNALRNGLSNFSGVNPVYSQDAITVFATPDQLELAQKILQDLDRPRKLYRLTYTLTETDAGKRIGVQHFALVVAGGQRTQMKQGNRVPLVTGTLAVIGAGPASPSTQITYIDVGLNVDATVDPLENGVALKTKVEESSVAGEMTSTLSQDPVIRQTTLEGTSVLQLGKTIELGSLDVLGSTRHTQVEVVAELVK